jgi:hypothetical protein
MNAAKVPKKLLLRFRKEGCSKICNFLTKLFVTADTEVNHYNKSYLTNLPVSDMKENVRVIPFSIVKSNGPGCCGKETEKTVPSFMFWTGNRSLLTSTRRCPTSICGPCSLLHSLIKITFFSRMVCLAQSHFHAGVC